MARKSNHPKGVTTVLRFRSHNPTTVQADYLARCAAGYHTSWNQAVALRRAAVRQFGRVDTWIDRDGVEHEERREPKAGTTDMAGFNAFVKLGRKLPVFKSAAGPFIHDGRPMPWESIPAQIVQYAMARLDGNWQSFWGHIKAGRCDANPPSFRRFRSSDPYWGMPSQASSSSPLDTHKVFRTVDPYPTPGLPPVTSAKAGWVLLPNVQARDWKIAEADRWVRVIAHRPIPADARITNQAWSFRDGHWWCLLTIDRPVADTSPEDAPVVIGVDRGINKSAFTFAFQPSTGEVVSDKSFPRTPGLTAQEKRRMRLLERSLARKHHQNSPGCFDERGAHVKGSCEWKSSGMSSRGRAKTVVDEIARLRARAARRRKEHVEQQSRFLVETADVIVFEDLHVKQMMKSAKGTAEAPGAGVAQKRGLNRSIGEQSWAALKTRTAQKAAGEAVDGRDVRVVEVPARNTSRRCSSCGWVSKRSRKGERFVCVECGHADDADRNAAINIALLAVEQLRSDGTLTAGGNSSSGPTRFVERHPVRDGVLGRLGIPRWRQRSRGGRSEACLVNVCGGHYQDQGAVGGFGPEPPVIQAVETSTGNVNPLDVHGAWRDGSALGLFRDGAWQVGVHLVE